MGEYRTTNNKRQEPMCNTYGHLQPQATEMEKAVLGALMIDKDAYAIVCEILRPESFYEPRNQMVYAAIRDLSMEEKPVDMLTVTDRLTKSGHLEQVGGPGYIAELSSGVATSANIEYHANVIAQKALARNLIIVTDAAQKKAFDEQTEDIEDVIHETQEALFELEKNCATEEFKSLHDVMVEANTAINAAAACPDGITGIPSYESIDKITAGFQDSHYIVVGARPSMGKTAFALSLARKIAIDRNIPVAFFSLEMSNVQLGMRLISNVCEIPGQTLNTGRLTREEWDRYDKRTSLLLNAPIYFDDTPGITVGEFRSKAMKLVREKGVKIIFIDYLQLMHYGGKRFNTRQEEIQEISKSLKSIAKKLRIPIVVLAQLNRESAKRQGEDKRPLPSDLRESGAIEQDADIVILLHRPEYYGMLTDANGKSLVGVAEVIIGKNRNGVTKTAPPLRMQFRHELMRFDEEEFIGKQKTQAENNDSNLPF